MGVSGLAVASSELTNGQSIETVQGKDVTVTINPNGVFINTESQVVTPDVEATNGIVHIVNKVLVPPGFEPGSDKDIVELAQATDDLSTLVQAVVAGGLVDTLKSTGPFTVFAPTNDAFGKLDAKLLDALLKPENKEKLAAVLTYHVVANGKVASSDLTDGQQITTVQGENVTVTINTNGVFINTDPQVVTPDVEATNGIVHIINKVLVPPNLVLPVYQNIVELAQATDDLSTLVQAVVAADLVATLTSAGPFTVFAPTNDAFGALPAGLLDTLLKPEN